MNQIRMSRRGLAAVCSAAALATVLLAGAVSSIHAQAPGQAPGQGPGRGQAPPEPPPVGPVKLDIGDGSSASYRVREQLAGISFPSDAVGTTTTFTGTLALNADGTVNTAASKLSIDLRNLKSDQDMRDGYIQRRTLETDKFPMAEFVPKKISGVPNPLPIQGQSGFQLSGDMTVHGTTSPVTWNGVVTFSKDGASGRAMTDFTFMTFGLMKPQLARLLSVDDKIALEVVFKMKRS